MTGHVDVHLEWMNVIDHDAAARVLGERQRATVLVGQREVGGRAGSRRIRGPVNAGAGLVSWLSDSAVTVPRPRPRATSRTPQDTQEQGAHHAEARLHAR